MAESARSRRRTPSGRSGGRVGAAHSPRRPRPMGEERILGETASTRPARCPMGASGAGAAVERDRCRRRRGERVLVRGVAPRRRGRKAVDGRIGGCDHPPRERGGRPGALRRLARCERASRADARPSAIRCAPVHTKPSARRSGGAGSVGDAPGAAAEPEPGRGGVAGPPGVRGPAANPSPRGESRDCARAGPSAGGPRCGDVRRAVHDEGQAVLIQIYIFRTRPLPA